MINLNSLQCIYLVYFKIKIKMLEQGCKFGM
jgi:hypothetical protein